jgi:glycosyltransferase involved in cell wall biosynthesis
MKILQVAERTHPAMGGVELHTAMIARELARRGHDVTLVVFNSLDQRDCGVGLTYQPPFLITKPARPSLPESEIWNGVRILRFSSRAQAFSYYWSPGMLQWLLNHINEFDVVHTHCFRFSNNEFTALAYLLKGRRVPIVFTCHDAARLDYMGLPVLILDEVYRRTIGKMLVDVASRLIALTETNAREYTEFLFANPSKIRTVPNGIDFEKYQNLPEPSDLWERLGKPEQTVLYIGRFIGYKNPDKLILAFREILKKYPRSHLLLIGKDYGLFDYCKSLAGPNVTFMENVGEETKLKALALADVCVIPSSYEGFGIVALEVQASGVSVVATQGGGLKHIVVNGITGLQIKSPSPKEISNAVCLLLGNEQLRKEFGEKGRAFSKRFSWESVVQQLESIYNEINRK